MVDNQPRRMGDGLNLDDVKEIQADAAKITARRFKEAAEDGNFTPTQYTGKTLRQLEEEADAANKKEGK